MAQISLEQWKALVAVVEEGGYAPAAARLFKSQSAVTYAVQKLERLLQVPVFRLAGRKAVLTASGRALYERARALVDDAERLEHAARGLAAGVEPVIRVAVDALFPTWLMLGCLGRFAEEFPDTRVELTEAVLGGTDEALIERRVDLAIGTAIPQGFSGEAVMRVDFVPVAHPAHPLHALGRELTLRDLRAHRHLVVRDSALEHKRTGVGGLEQQRRWTVSNKATSIAAACMGLGFAWYAQGLIERELRAGQLRVLPMRDGGRRFATLYLMLADADLAGPAVRHLAHTLRAATAGRDGEAARESAA